MNNSFEAHLNAFPSLVILALPLTLNASASSTIATSMQDDSSMSRPQYLPGEDALSVVKSRESDSFGNSILLDLLRGIDD